MVKKPTPAPEKPKRKASTKPKKPAKARKAAIGNDAPIVEEKTRAAWDDRFISIAETILHMGASEAQLALALGCEIEDIAWWREEHPQFDAVFGKMRGQGLRGGRPTEYDPKYITIAKKMGELGATDLEVAQAFEVSIRTIYRWKLEHPEFAEALEVGKDVADQAVERSLYKRAVGYTFDGEDIKVVDGEIVRIERMEHVPPDPKAAMFWLQNRRPENWKAVNRVKIDAEQGGSLERFLNEISGHAIAPREDDAAIDGEDDEPVRTIGPKDDD